MRPEDPYDKTGPDPVIDETPTCPTCGTQRWIHYEEALCFRYSVIDTVDGQIKGAVGEWTEMGTDYRDGGVRCANGHVPTDAIDEAIFDYPWNDDDDMEVTTADMNAVNP